VLEADGDAEVFDASHAGTRYVRFLVDAPGYGVGLCAEFEYEEWYRRTGAAWALTDYQYELRLSPAGTGRFAYHWHDDTYHVHCQAGPAPAHAHYRGYAVDLLRDARPDLVRMYAAGQIDCSRLHPLVG